MQPPLHHGDGGGHGPGGADVALHLAGDFQILRIGHPVGDDRTFERHDGAIVTQGGGDLIAQMQGQGGGGHILVSPET